MIREGTARVDKDVVDICRAELVKVLLEYTVNVSLEGGWSTSQAKGGDQPLEEAVPRTESRLLLVSLLDPDLVKCRDHI